MQDVRPSRWCVFVCLLDSASAMVWCLVCCLLDCAVRVFWDGFVCGLHSRPPVVCLPYGRYVGGARVCVDSGWCVLDVVRVCFYS